MSTVKFNKLDEATRALVDAEAALYSARKNLQDHLDISMPVRTIVSNGDFFREEDGSVVFSSYGSHPSSETVPVHRATTWCLVPSTDCCLIFDGHGSVSLIMGRKTGMKENLLEVPYPARDHSIPY